MIAVKDLKEGHYYQIMQDAREYRYNGTDGGGRFTFVAERGGFMFRKTLTELPVKLLDRAPNMTGLQ